MMALARAPLVSARPTARLPSRARPARRTMVTKAMAAQEIAQVANEAAFIAGTAGVMCAMTLVGLAVGFVLLRVESLIEEGKISL